jgi:hypothetical protein
MSHAGQPFYSKDEFVNAICRIRQDAKDGQRALRP